MIQRNRPQDGTEALNTHKITLNALVAETSQTGPSGAPFQSKKL